MAAFITLAVKMGAVCTSDGGTIKLAKIPSDFGMEE